MEILKASGEDIVMTNRFRRYWSAFSLVTIATLGFLSPTSVMAVDVYTDPVGFVKSTVTNTLSGSTFTPIALPLQRMKADQGLVSASPAVTSISFSDTTKNWSGTNWWDANALHYVEFLTGAAVGRFFAVETNTATTITLSVGSEDLAGLGVTGGDRYVIRPFWRISDVFGPATNTPLQGALAAGNADNIFIFDQGVYKTIYPRTLAASTNWFMVGTGIVNNFPLFPDEAVFVYRRNGGATNLTLIGEVKTTNHVTVLDLGFNFVGNAFPAGSIIGNNDLVSPSTGFKGAANAGAADNLFVWDQAGQVWRTVFYRTLAASTNWFMVGVSVTNNLVLESGQGYLIQNKTQGGKWNRPLPYNP